MVFGEISECHAPCTKGCSKEGRLGLIASSETYESNFPVHDFVQFGKQHSRCKAILPSTVLSQQCCEQRRIVITGALSYCGPSGRLATTDVIRISTAGARYIH